MDQATPTPTSSPAPGAAPDTHPVLAEALQRQKPRYFRVGGGAARGKTGRVDTERFADELVTLRECAQIIGDRLEMSAISYAVIYDGPETLGFRFDPNSDPRKPELVGALVNRRMPMRDLLSGLNDFMNE
jgi:hypothetical protein